MVGNQNMIIFDRVLVKKHRERAAASFANHSFLFENVAERLAERLEDINRAFDQVLDLGARSDHLGQKIHCSDLVKAEDEEQLSIAEARFDLVCSNLSLHWVNDLPGALIQAKNVLKPDGLFLAALFGGDTLSELRQALLHAETGLTGGASPRISPFGDVKSLGQLLQRAGYAMPVADVDMIQVSYDNIYALMQDLRGMGETNALLDRPEVRPCGGVRAGAGVNPAGVFAACVSVYVWELATRG